MPIYEYECIVCGGFSAGRPMALYQEPADCPGCGQHSPRALLSAPAFAGMPEATRKAHAPKKSGKIEPTEEGGTHASWHTTLTNRPIHRKEIHEQFAAAHWIFGFVGHRKRQARTAWRACCASLPLRLTSPAAAGLTTHPGSSQRPFD